MILHLLIFQIMSYQCLICWDEYPVGPVLTSCHHIYCYECLAKCNSNKCPTCRKKITQKNIQHFMWELWLNDPDQTKLPKDYRSRSAETYFKIHQKSNQNFSKELQQSAKFGHEPAIYKLAHYYESTNQIKEACQQFDKLSLDWFRNNLKKIDDISEIYQKLNPPNLERAQQILELDQTSRGWNNLGVFFYYRHNFKMAKKCFNKALKFEPNEPLYLTNFAFTTLDPQKRIKIIMKSQHHNALNELSCMYLVGFGVEISFPLAFEYISQSTQKNTKYISDLLGFHEYGWGTPKNPGKVDELFRKYQNKLKPDFKLWYYTRRQQFQKNRDMEKSIQNKKITKSWIGDIYRLGQGGPKDMKKAMEYYLDDFNRNETIGIVRLASFPNPHQDQAWEKLQQIKIKPEFTKLPIIYTSDMYNPDVMFDIGKVYLIHDEFTKACQWFEKARLYGSEKAQGVMDVFQCAKTIEVIKPTKRKAE